MAVLDTTYIEESCLECIGFFCWFQISAREVGKYSLGSTILIGKMKQMSKTCCFSYTFVYKYMTIKSFSSKKKGGRGFGALEIQENKYRELFLLYLFWVTALSTLFKITSSFSILSLFYMVLLIFMTFDILKSYKVLVKQKRYLLTSFLQR